MSTGQTNALALSSSAYLRSAMHQPTHWHPWGPEAFALARQLDKPILLDIGAVWCHWCHVMDRESYESPEIAAILNEHFIAIKVDRDERPDVDARYQVAVAAINGQGGWPLTVFLLPDGRPFYGGTYFPPADGFGRPSFPRILQAIATAFHERREEVERESAEMMKVLEHTEGMSGHRADFTPRIVEQMVQSALGNFDRVHGGFSAAPKFPHPPILDLLADWYARTGEEQVRTVLTVTLEKMAAGGVYDQLAGGFHRYSVDERWCVPHFEKMAYDNSELLKNYVHAYQATGEERFAIVARDILRWLREVLSDRENGGYYGSQDADINLEDDGDFFTWSFDEARAVLEDQELAVACARYDIGPHGEMHHAPERNVLWVASELEEIAAVQGLALEQVTTLLDSARRKLLAARLKRPAPFVDRTLYTNWNALLIAATLEAARVLGEGEEQEFALLSLDRLLREGRADSGELHHVIAYAEGSGERPAAVLDDYAFTILACLEAFESSSDLRYFESARELTEEMIRLFHDEKEGGFFDLATNSAAIGALATRRKPFQDAPTPAADSAAAIALLRLAALTHDERLRELARGTLELFAGVAERYGIFAATYGVASVWMSRPPMQIIVLGTGAGAEALYAEAVAPFALGKVVLRARSPESAATSLPPALAELIAAAPQPAGNEAVALLCSGFTCLPPLHTPEAMRAALAAILRGTR